MIGGADQFDYPQHLRFECERCALCCGDAPGRLRRILLLKTGADRISEHTSMEVDEFAEKIQGFEPYIYRIKKTINGKCVFLRRNSCSIYKVRPLICVFYPFQLKNLEGGKHVFTYTEECPGIGQGQLLEERFFQELFTKAKDCMRDA